MVRKVLATKKRERSHLSAPSIARVKAPAKQRARCKLTRALATEGVLRALFGQANLTSCALSPRCPSMEPAPARLPNWRGSSVSRISHGTANKRRFVLTAW